MWPKLFRAPGPARLGGFSLVEMAVVLAIVALLVGGMLLPLTAQNDLRRAQETRATLARVSEALIGHAIAVGRLPCPAGATSQGQEAYVGTVGASDCARPYDGFVPGATLGLVPVDDQGYVLDGWGQRLRYAVTAGNAAGSLAFTRQAGAGGMKDRGLGGLAPELRVCSSSSGVIGAGTATAECAANALLSKTAVAVVWSHGANGARGGSGDDEKHNPNPIDTSIAADRLFISHLPAPTGASGGEFDDLLLWLSPHVLYARLIAAGQLP